MERLDRAKRAWAPIVVSVLPAVVLASGCGDDDDYANELRPPTPIVISAAISDKRVSVSPRMFGAGPVTLVVTNQTERAQEVRLETDESIEQRSGPISPGDTASLKADLRRGTYSVGVEGGRIAAAALKVGAQRPSSQDQLLQP